MTKLQQEVVYHIKQLKEEHGCEIYLRYMYHTKKVHAIKLIEGNKCEVLSPLCGHSTAIDMLDKGILIEDILGESKVCKLA